MTAKTYSVVTLQADGKRIVEEFPMTKSMEEAMGACQRWWEQHGCKCTNPDPDCVLVTPRGHSVDVACTDCGGMRQVG